MGFSGCVSEHAGLKAQVDLENYCFHQIENASKLKYPSHFVYTKTNKFSFNKDLRITRQQQQWNSTGKMDGN